MTLAIVTDFPTPRIIAAAAIRLHGVIYALPPPAGHHLIKRHARTLIKNPDDIHEADQGFIDDKARFLSRLDALPIARDADQLIGEPGNPTLGLFSEDLKGYVDYLQGWADHGAACRAQGLPPTACPLYRSENLPSTTGELHLMWTTRVNAWGTGYHAVDVKSDP